MPGERDTSSRFDGFAPPPPDTEQLDGWLRRDGEAWQARTPDTRRLDALARSLAATLDIPEPDRPPASSSHPPEARLEVPAVRVIPFLRRSRTQNLLSAAAMLAIVSLMAVLLVGLAHRGPGGATLATATPLATPLASRPVPSQTPLPEATATPSAQRGPGTLLWRFQTGNIIESTPAVANGVVYLGGADANLYAINARTGKRIWAVSVGATVQGTVTVAGGIVYLTGVDGAVYAFQTSNGARVWRQQPPGAAFGAFTVSGGVVYVGSANNDASPSKLYALTAQTGTTLWTVQMNGLVHSAPVVDGETLYAVAQAPSGGTGFFASAISLSSHAQLWQVPVQGFALAEANGILYSAGGTPNLTAYNATTGKQLWSKALDSQSGTGTSPPTLVDGVVYAATGAGSLYVLSASSGTQLWSYHTSGEILSTPTVANGVVYVGSTDNTVYALKSPGVAAWSYQTGGMVETSAAVAGDVVYIGSNDHNLYAFVA